jgi:hypothetical protein
MVVLFAVSMVMAYTTTLLKSNSNCDLRQHRVISPRKFFHQRQEGEQGTRNQCLFDFCSVRSSSRTFLAMAATASSKGGSNKKKSSSNKAIPWIACSSNTEVQRAISLFVREGDRVCELGAQLRDTSTQICDTIGPNGYAFFVDTERKAPPNKGLQHKAYMRQCCGEEKTYYTDRSHFVELEHFDLWRQAFACQGSQKGKKMSFDVLVLDVGMMTGNDLDLTTISVLQDFLALNNNNENTVNHGVTSATSSTLKRARVEQQDAPSSLRLAIIKSSSLTDLSKRLVHSERLFSKHAQLPSRPQHEGESEPPNAISTVPHTTQYVASIGVEKYRRTIPFTVHKGDVVLEIGCHFGTSTALLHGAALRAPSQSDETPNVNIEKGGCLGVDIGRKIINAARKNYDHIPFEVADAWKTADLQQLRAHHFPSSTATLSCSSDATPKERNPFGYDVVYVDVGGLSGSDGLLDTIGLISALSNSLQPFSIVVKSACLSRLASSLRPFSDIWQTAYKKQMCTEKDSS